MMSHNMFVPLVFIGVVFIFVGGLLMLGQVLFEPSVEPDYTQPAEDAVCIPPTPQPEPAPAPTPSTTAPVNISATRVHSVVSKPISTTTTQPVNPTPTYWNDTRQNPDGYPRVGGGCCGKKCIPACEFPWWCE